jgi:hypothetical protein
VGLEDDRSHLQVTDTARIFLVFKSVRKLTFTVLVAVSTILVLSWVLAPCGFVGRFQRFGETCCLHLPGSSDPAGK